MKKKRRFSNFKHKSFWFSFYKLISKIKEGEGERERDRGRERERGRLVLSIRCPRRVPRLC